MTIEEMKERKRQLGLTNEQVSEWSGVPLGTVQKVFSGITKSPRYETLQALERLLEKDKAAYHTGNSSEEFHDTVYEKNGQIQQFAVREESCYATDGSSAVKTEKKQGEFTVEDYLKLPDDQRYELIDGVLFVMESPTSVHQMLAGLIYRDLSNYVFDKGGDCLPFVSPLDVQLDCDDRTMVQPDVIIVSDRSKMVRGRCFGAPDFLAEVLSPSTRRKDMILKLNKYQAAGVREYWIIDPSKKHVMVYLFQNNDVDCTIYGFDSKIPVGIYNGECIIDFGKIWERSAWLMDTES